MATFHLFLTHDQRVVPLLDKQAIEQGKQMKEFLGTYVGEDENFLPQLDVEMYEVIDEQNFRRRSDAEIMEDRLKIVEKVRAMDLPKDIPAKDTRRKALSHKTTEVKGKGNATVVNPR